VLDSLCQGLLVVIVTVVASKAFLHNLVFVWAATSTSRIRRIQQGSIFVLLIALLITLLITIVIALLTTLLLYSRRFT
jgi:hypothetical protein